MSECYIAEILVSTTKTEAVSSVLVGESMAGIQGPAGPPGPAGGGGSGDYWESLTGVQDGVNTVFETSQDIYSVGQCYVNGIPSPDYYTVTDTREITLASPPKDWWILEIRYRSV